MAIIEVQWLLKYVPLKSLKYEQHRYKYLKFSFIFGTSVVTKGYNNTGSLSSIKVEL